MIYRHGKLYSEEYNYSPAFEAYVAGGMAEFYASYHAATDQVWICEYQEKIVGFLLLMQWVEEDALDIFVILTVVLHGDPEIQTALQLNDGIVHDGA